MPKVSEIVSLSCRRALRISAICLIVLLWSFFFLLRYAGYCESMKWIPAENVSGESSAPDEIIPEHIMGVILEISLWYSSRTPLTRASFVIRRIFIHISGNKFLHEPDVKFLKEGGIYYCPVRNHRLSNAFSNSKLLGLRS